MIVMLSEVLVLGEEIVQHPQCRFQIVVDNVLRSGLWLGQAAILHQLKGQSHVGDLFVKCLERIQNPKLNPLLCFNQFTCGVKWNSYNGTK